MLPSDVLLLVDPDTVVPDAPVVVVHLQPFVFDGRLVGVNDAVRMGHDRLAVTVRELQGLNL